jgi:hypothetical protein
VCAHRRGEWLGVEKKHETWWKWTGNWTMKNGGQLGFNYETGGNHHIYIYIYILYDNDGMIDWILTIMMIISAKLKKSRHPRYVDQRLSKSKYTPCWTSQWHPQNKLGSLRSFTMIKSLLFFTLMIMVTCCFILWLLVTVVIKVDYVDLTINWRKRWIEPNHERNERTKDYDVFSFQTWWISMGI